MPAVFNIYFGHCWCSLLAHLALAMRVQQNGHSHYALLAGQHGPPHSGTAPHFFLSIHIAARPPIRTAITIHLEQCPQLVPSYSRRRILTGRILTWIPVSHSACSPIFLWTKLVLPPLSVQLLAILDLLHPPS